jgi:hypothetical protein
MYAWMFACLEFLFLWSFWWQTRLDLARYWHFSSPSLTIDYLLPFLYLSDVLCCLLIVVWLILHHSSLRWPSISISGWWFVGFLIICLSGLLFHEVGIWGWWKLCKLVELAGLVWFLSQRWRDLKVVRRYAQVLIVGLMCEIFLMIAESVRGGSIGWQWVGEWHYDRFTNGVATVQLFGATYLRPMGTFPHPNVVAGILAIALPVSIFYFDEVFTQYTTEWGRRCGVWLGYVWILISIIGLTLTFSRSAWLTCLGLTAFLSWHHRTIVVELLTHNRRIFYGCTGLIVVGFLIFSPLAVARFSSLAGSDSLSYTRRVQLQRVGWDLVQRHPLGGVGLNNFLPQLLTYGPLYGVGIWRQPIHNVLFLIAVETGIIGLSFFTMSLIYLIVPTMAMVRQTWPTPSKDAWCVTGCWVAVLGISVVDHYWWTSQQGLFSVALVWAATLISRRNTV